MNAAQDAVVQCTRCKNKHLKSDRVETKPDRSGLRTLACPRCGGHSFYDEPIAKQRRSKGVAHVA